MKKSQKKFFTILATFVISIFAIGAPMASQAYNNEEIQSYHQEFFINKNGTVAVLENINYDFKQNERHGIYRYIPYLYRGFGWYEHFLRLTNFSVSKNDFYEPYSKKKSNGDYFLRIGDPDATINGLHNYQIGYTVHNSIVEENGQPLFRWNVIGDGWDVQIANISAVFHLPEGVPVYSVIKSCLDKDCSIRNIDEHSFEVSYPSLSYYDPLTVEIIFPIGAVATLSTGTKMWFFARTHFLWIPVIFFLYVLIRLKRKYAKSEPGKGNIITQFSPPDDLSPITSGYIIDGKFNDRDFSAQIINLAVNGHIKIKQLSKNDYELSLRSDLNKITSPIDKKIITALFTKSTAGGKINNTVKLSELKYDFATKLLIIKEVSLKELMKKDYYKFDPDKSKSVFILLAIFIGIFLFLTFSTFASSNNTSKGFSIVTAFILCIYSIYLSIKAEALTEKGAVTREDTKGFMRYLNVAEKDRLDFHNAPEKKPEIFEKYLPFAIAYGVEKKWAKKFEGIFKSPKWFEGIQPTTDVNVFTQSIRTFNTSSAFALTAARPSSSSSGGGGSFSSSSGGGFGGGGGGSW